MLKLDLDFERKEASGSLEFLSFWDLDEILVEPFSAKVPR